MNTDICFSSASLSLLGTTSFTQVPAKDPFDSSGDEAPAPAPAAAPAAAAAAAAPAPVEDPAGCAKNLRVLKERGNDPRAPSPRFILRNKPVELMFELGLSGAVVIARSSHIPFGAQKEKGQIQTCNHSPVHLP